VKRREFITLIGGAAAAWPLAARAQQPMPVIGFVWPGQTSSEAAPYLTAFHHGLREVGFVEGQNVAIEYRWAGGQYERLPALMTELVHLHVAVIVGNAPSSVAAKTATSTIPIVFFTGVDPVRLGIVASFNRPGGNATGVSFLTTALEAKRLGLLRELLPQATAVAALVDPKAPDSASQLRELQDAARALGLETHVLQANTEIELDRGFATVAGQQRDALVVASSPFFNAQRRRIVELAARHSLPTMYNVREFPVAGGLISYGASIADALRHVGTYAGRILKGDNPADLPVLQPTKFELVINLKTAKVLGLSVPDRLLALADEIIE
jgi:putative tryptophan/tyrosine transport system substrate-binding protein